MTIGAHNLTYYQAVHIAVYMFLPYRRNM